MKTTAYWCALLLGLMLPLAAAAAPAPRALTFGVLPLQSPVRLARMFIPLCRRLSAQLHRPVAFATAPNFTVFMQRVRAGRYDLIFTNPYLYRASPGYRAVVRIKGLPFRGLIIVRRHGPVRTLNRSSLQGLRIAFPDPTAFAATLLVRQYLRARGVHVRRDMKPVYLGTQDSVILAVARGLVDVGGTWPWSLAAEPASVRSRIQVLGATPPAPQMPIAVSATLMEHDPRTVAALRQALLALPRDVRGRRLLLRLGLPEGFTRARPGDYRAVPVLPRASSR